MRTKAMERTTNRVKRLAAFALLACVLCPAAGAQKLQYPASKKVEQTDTYFGVKVADPYRWLEDEGSPETARWVEEQNKVTFAYLEKIPYRAQVKERLAKLYNYARYTAPYRRGEYYFFSKNDGLQNQSVVYMQKGLDGAPEVLLDPNKFSAEGTTQLGGLAISRDAKYAAYCKASGGSDWRDCFVMEAVTKKQLPDVLNWVKVSGLAWQGDGFYYSRYDAPEKGKELFFRDAKAGDKTWRPLVAEIGDSDFGVIDDIGDKLLVETNHKAPNGRVFLFDPKNPAEKDWKDVLPEKAEPLQGANTGGGKLFATYLKDVTTRSYVYSLDGKPENEVQLPGPGVAGT